MRATSLILMLSLPMLPSGNWNGAPSAPEICNYAGGCSGDHESAREIVAHDYGLRERDLERLSDGSIITGTFPAADKREMTLVGVVKLGATPAQFADYAEKVERLFAPEYVTALGHFGLSDLNDAVLSYPVLPDDVREVQSCEVGNCDVKLPQSIILDLSRLNTSAAGFDQQVMAVIRQWLHRYLSSYLRDGNAALVEYGDKDPPQSLHDGFSRLIANAHVLAYRAPRLFDYLKGNVERPPLGVRESMFWSVEDIGLRPLTTITHSAIHSTLDEDNPDLWVGMKLLYASHYLHASLRLMRVIPEWSAVEPTSYLVCVDRLLFDEELGGLKRAIAKRRMRSRLEDRLRTISDSVSAHRLVMAHQTERR